MRRSKYFALATGLVFAMPAHAQTTEKATITLPPGSKDTVKPTTNTEAGPPQLQKAGEHQIDDDNDEVDNDNNDKVTTSSS